MASVEDPFLSVLGRDSSTDASWAPELGGRSPVLEVEVPAPSVRRPVVQVSEE